MNVLAILLLIAANLFTLKAVYNKPGPEGPPVFIRQVPVLIYHNITNNSVKGSPLYISAKNFARQMKCLHDSGFHTILPNQLEAYYRGVTILPAKPFMISFDDAHIEQYTLATPVINQYGFKAVFFIMTVTIDKKGFLSSVQIKQLAQQGHVTGAHTWDHPNLKRLQPAQWDKQLIQPKKYWKPLPENRLTALPIPLAFGMNIFWPG